MPRAPRTCRRRPPDVTSGPISVPGVERIADRHLRVRARQASRSSRSRSPDATMIRRVDVQRWPAVPTAPKTMARVARSSLASFVTTIALLPPSSRIVRPNRDATTSATRRPTAVEPVNDTSGSRGSASMPLAHDPARPDEQREDPRHAVVGHHPVGDVLHGDGGERRRLGGLPDDGIAADRGDRRVPRPHGHREIERRDHAHGPERMPLLHHPVARAART